jgi:membrane associated rhomboid family serine protease
MTGQNAAPDAQRLLEQAREAADQGEYQQASVLYSRLVGNSDPTMHVAGLLGLADSRYRLDDEQGALQAWIVATQGPETALTWEAWKQLAGARVREGNNAAAARAYREAERRAPAEERPAIASRLGWLNKEMGHSWTAQRYFGRARTGVFSPMATYAIIGITAAISLFIGFGGQQGAELGRLFELDKQAVFVHHEYWRLLTVTLVHAPPPEIVLHLGFNMYALYIVGPLAEALYGRITYVGIYVLAALGGSIGSYLVFATPSVGASGAIFGLFGLIFTAMYVHKPALTRQARGLAGQIGILIVLNLFIGFSVGGIDNAAHIGGLLSGAWLGMVVAPRGTATLASFWQGARGAALDTPLVRIGGVLLLVLVLFVLLFFVTPFWA